MGTFSNRWSYGIAFGATANKVMFLFSEGYQPLHIPQWAQGKVCLIPAGNFVMESLALRDCLAGVPWDQEINFVSSVPHQLLAPGKCLAHQVSKLIYGAFPQ